MSETKKVYAAIAAVTKSLSKEGIAKGRKNTQQGYQFRGIDDVYNALAPFLADANLCILPRVESREVVERETKAGGALFYVTVKVDFAFVSAEDASEHHVVTYGEAMDSGDKATNKAMSAAYKYAAMQAFCIPTEGDNDADSQTHEVAARKAEAARQLAKTERPQTKPTAEQETRAMDWIASMDECANLDELKAKFEKAYSEVHAYGFPMLDNNLIAAKDSRKAKLSGERKAA